MLEIQKLLTESKTLTQEVAQKLKRPQYLIMRFAQDNARFNSKMILLETINEIEKTNYTIAQLYRKASKK